MAQPFVRFFWILDVDDLQMRVWGSENSMGLFPVKCGQFDEPNDGIEQLQRMPMAKTAANPNSMVKTAKNGALRRKETRPA